MKDQHRDDLAIRGRRVGSGVGRRSRSELAVVSVLQASRPLLDAERITPTIWLIGTKRRVTVVDALPKALADLEYPYMSLTGDDHSYIYGDFTLCPVEEERPGHMRSVRVTAAEKVVVQNVDGRRSPFKVMSTWPKKEHQR